MPGEEIDLNHPRPFAPNRDGHGIFGQQLYACEGGENPDMKGVLWHAKCPKCMAHLQASLANDATATGTDLILMAHGGTFKETSTEIRVREIQNRIDPR
jgi:hypothetical protein